MNKRNDIKYGVSVMVTLPLDGLKQGVALGSPYEFEGEMVVDVRMADPELHAGHYNGVFTMRHVQPA